MIGIKTNKIWNIKSFKQSFPSFVGPNTRSDKFNKFMLVDMALKVSVFGSYFVSR
jgi:hypothetical protein